MRRWSLPPPAALSDRSSRTFPGKHHGTAMDAAAADALLCEAARLGVVLEPAAVARIGRFVDLLAVWNTRFHLTGERDPAVVVRKHVLDSLALVPYVGSRGALADIGSGAGFPGLVVACVRPEREVWLIESRRRPASFLGEAVRTIGLPAARVFHARADDVARECAALGGADVVTARALSLDVLLSLARPLLGMEGTVVAMQTPRTAAHAASIAARRGFRCLRRVDYRLSRGEARCLLFFVPVC